LSSVLKKHGHIPHLIFFKDDRAAVIDSIQRDREYFQYLFNSNFYGCGEDINPPSDREIGLLCEKVAEIAPHVIAISARSPSRELARRIVDTLRPVLPKARFIGGGYGPTNAPEYFLKFLDYICIGEGDQAIVDLVELPDPTTAQNVAWMEQGRLRVNPLSEVTDLDALPFPDWGFDNKFLIEDDTIVAMASAYDTKTYDIFVSKGCPTTCSYCQACQWPRMYSRFGGKIAKVRLRSPGSVIKELQTAKDHFGIQYVRFMDSIFGWDKKWLSAFLDLYESQIGLNFFCNTDARFIDEARVKRLRRAGLQLTQIGVQAVNERIRQEIMGRKIILVQDRF
jgi:radical SAM superfamily enzyme YgiQ (UPF0313 family)